MIQGFHAAAWDGTGDIANPSDMKRHLIMQVTGSDVLKLEHNSDQMEFLPIQRVQPMT